MRSRASTHPRWPPPSPALCVLIPVEPAAPLPVLLVRGEVTPTWALMPRLQEPVCDGGGGADAVDGVFLAEPPLSDSSDMSEGWRRLHLVPCSTRTPLSEPPSDRRTSSPDHAGCRTTPDAERFSASVTGYTHTRMRTHTHAHRHAHKQTHTPTRKHTTHPINDHEGTCFASCQRLQTQSLRLVLP